MLLLLEPFSNLWKVHFGHSPLCSSLSAYTFVLSRRVLGISSLVSPTLD